MSNEGTRNAEDGPTAEAEDGGIMDPLRPWDADDAMRALGRASCPPGVYAKVEAYIRWSSTRILRQGEILTAKSITNDVLNRRCQLAESRAHKAEEALRRYELLEAWLRPHNDDPFAALRHTHSDSYVPPDN